MLGNVLSLGGPGGEQNKCSGEPPQGGRGEGWMDCRGWEETLGSQGSVQVGDDGGVGREGGNGARKSRRIQRAGSRKCRQAWLWQVGEGEEGDKGGPLGGWFEHWVRVPVLEHLTAGLAKLPPYLSEAFCTRVSSPGRPRTWVQLLFCSSQQLPEAFFLQSFPGACPPSCGSSSPPCRAVMIDTPAGQ